MSNHVGELQDIFDRSECPTLAELLESGRWDYPSVVSHVSGCPGCRAELLMYRTFMEGGVAPLRQEVRWIVDQLAQEPVDAPSPQKLGRKGWRHAATAIWRRLVG